MILFKLPCDKQKCLMKPICANKQIIDCYYLTEYLTNISPYLNFNFKFQFIIYKTGILELIIKRFKKQFPNIIRVYSKISDNHFIFNDSLNPIPYKKDELTDYGLNLLIDSMIDLKEKENLNLSNKSKFKSKPIIAQLIKWYNSLRTILK